MKPIDKLAQKYALNINQLRGPKSSRIIDFKNLNIGFYDPIAKSDISIKKNRKILRKVKDSSLKEFIYSNKDIPEHWKHKSKYDDEILNIMVKDKDVLKYIGSGPFDEINDKKENNDRKINSFLTRNSHLENEKVLPDIKKTFDNMTKTNEYNKSLYIIDLEKNKDNIITEELVNDISTSKSNRSRVKSKPKKEYNEKEINNILEEFKINYPIKEKLKKLIDKTNYYSSKDFNTPINKSQNTTRNLRSNSYVKENKTLMKSVPKFTRSVFYNTIKNQQIFKRKNVIRQNVFNNLISNKDSFISKSTTNRSSKKLNPLILSDYKNFIKKIKVKIPIINKNLENLNFYGPYFSYCPPCFNKNIEFYNNLEANQCLELLHHIKKFKEKDNKKGDFDKKIYTSKETAISNMS